MPNTIVCNFGDIVLVPFPFTDQTTSKKRPAVIVSSDAYNQSRRDVIVMAITSQLRAEQLPTELVVADWHAAGLLKPSIIKPVVATVERSLILKKLGSLQPADIAALRVALHQIFG